MQDSMANGQLQNVEIIRGWIAQSTQTHNLITDYIQRFQGVNGALPPPQMIGSMRFNN